MIFTLLWFAVKGIFKLVWMFVSLPFKLIKTICKEIKAKKERNQAAAQKAEHDEKLHQNFENLYKKIIVDILNGNKPLPYEIDVYTAYVTLFYENGPKPKDFLYYDFYGSEELVGYTSFYVTSSLGFYDGGGQGSNQTLMLAKKINEAAGNIYIVHEVTSSYTTQHGDETYHYTKQMYVKMTKK